MRSAGIALLVSAVLVGASAPAQAKREPTVLTPSSPWNVDFGENRCLLGRFFGEGEDRHFLRVEQYFPGAGGGLTVAGPSFRRFRNLGDTQLSFSGKGEDREFTPFKGESGQFGHAVIFSAVGFREAREQISEDGETEEQAAPPAVPSDPIGFGELETEFGADIEYISIKQRNREVRFQTGPLDKVFEVLNTCTQDMVRDWGFDVEQQSARTKAPVPKDVQAVAKRIQARYPKSALRIGESGIFRIRLTIDEEGRVAECFLNEATVTRRLDSPACEEMARMEFDPALDANGEPLRSFYATTITYRMQY